MKIKFNIRCELDYLVQGRSEFWFNVQAVGSEQQKIVTESLAIAGACSQSEQRDPHFGNRVIRAAANAGAVKLTYATSLEVDYYCIPHHAIQEVPVAELPADLMPYVLPSRYCQSDRLIQLATHRFGNLPHGYQRVQAVCDWVYNHVSFVPGVTNWQSSAEDILVQGAGVCRDFAHLTIALLRALNIPARFVTAYDYGVDPVWGPTDFHAYVEAYLDGRWWIFDPARLCPRNGLVRIGNGRDAADVAFATIFGPSKYVGMKLEIDPSSEILPDDKTMGVSTSQLDSVAAKVSELRPYAAAA